MASETPKKEVSESIKQLVKGYEYITGSLDFERYARDHSISVEAARKRFKRAFVANNLNVTTNVNNIVCGSDDGPSTPVKGSKRKNADDPTDSPTKKTPGTKTPKSATKKAKVSKEDTEEVAGDGAAIEE